MGYSIGIIATGVADQRAVKLSRVIGMVMPTAACVTLNFRHSVRDYWVQKKNTKASYEVGATGRENFAKHFAVVAPKYEAFVCFDVALAHHLLEARDTKGLTDTNKLAGMVIEYMGKKILFVADPLAMYDRGATDEEQAGAGYITAFHLHKLKNRIENRPVVQRPAKIIIPQSMADLQKCKEIAAKSTLIAADIETSGGLISCIGFACDTGGPEIPTIVIPFMQNIEKEDKRYWNSEEALEAALRTVGEILANPVPKVFHNGGYDLTHIFRYGWVPNNFIWDTMLLMQSAWPTLPRALYVGASMFLDNYRYWKDDAKDVGDDGKVKWQAPKTAEATFRYWQYNGEDCANTLELCRALLAYFAGADAGRFPLPTTNFDYVWLTYLRKFLLEFGPAFYMSMNGLKADRMRQLALKQTLLREAAEKRQELDLLIGVEDFNPNSPPQTQRLLYDWLRLKVPARIGRTSDKRYLTKFADQHPILATIISALSAAKEPANNASKYGELPLLGGERFLAQFKAAVTTTSRLSSATHNLKVGTNLQNVPKAMRVFMVADDGRTLVCSDYSQSDSYGVAFYSGDESMITAVLDDRDTHSVHVEFFFGYAYDDVVRGNEAKELWVVHPVTGVRQIIKKVSHGTHYDMGGETMLLNIRRDAAITMVKALLSSARAPHFMQAMGFDPAKGIEHYLAETSLYSDSVLAKACDYAQGLYYERYPTLAKWKTQAVATAQVNGGVIEMFGGSSTRMLCPPKKNPRFVPAAYGQGFTSGNCNNAMLRLFFMCEDMWAAGFDMHLQVHDEIIASIPDGRYDLVARKKAVMEAPCEIRGRVFHVPVECEMAKSWDPKNMVVWKGFGPDYHEEVAKCEKKTLKKLGL